MSCEREASLRRCDRRGALVLGLALAVVLGAGAEAGAQWATQAIGDVKVQVPAGWKKLYKSADGAGWYVGQLESPQASFTVVREETVSGYTSELRVLHRQNIGVSGHPAVFYDGISKDGAVRLWLLLSKKRMSDGRRLAFVAASPNNVWVQYDATYRKIFQTIAIPGGKVEGPQIATTFPLDKARKGLWVHASCGEVALRIPATWRAIPGAPKGEGGWFVGKVESPEASFSVVREKDFAGYTKGLAVQQTQQTILTGHRATFFACTSKSGKYTLWIVTLNQAGADGRKIGFVAAAPAGFWKDHEADFKRALQSIKIPGGRAEGPDIATAPPWEVPGPLPKIPPPPPDVEEPKPPIPPPPPPPDVEKPKPPPKIPPPPPDVEKPKPEDPVSPPDVEAPKPKPPIPPPPPDVERPKPPIPPPPPDVERPKPPIPPPPPDVEKPKPPPKIPPPPPDVEKPKPEDPVSPPDVEAPKPKPPTPPPPPDVEKPKPKPPTPPPPPEDERPTPDPPPPPPDVEKPKPPPTKPPLRKRMRKLLPPVLDKLLRRPKTAPAKPPAPPEPPKKPGPAEGARKVHSCVEKWANGKVRQEYTYYAGSEFKAGMQWVGNAPEDQGGGYKVLHGTYRRYRNDGKREYEAEFRDGFPDGPAKGWWPSGTKQFEGVYKMGKIVDGTWKVWGRDGKPSTSEATGIYP